MEGRRSPFKMLIGKPTGKRSLGRPRRRWEDNIKRILKKLVSIRVIESIRLWMGITGEHLCMRH